MMTKFIYLALLTLFTASATLSAIGDNETATGGPAAPDKDGKDKKDKKDKKHKDKKDKKDKK